MWILYMSIIMTLSGVDSSMQVPIRNYTTEIDCNTAKDEIWAQMNLVYSPAEQQSYSFVCRLQGI